MPASGRVARAVRQPLSAPSAQHISASSRYISSFDLGFTRRWKHQNADPTHLHPTGKQPPQTSVMLRRKPSLPRKIMAGRTAGPLLRGSSWPTFHQQVPKMHCTPRSWRRKSMAPHQDRACKRPVAIVRSRALSCTHGSANRRMIWPATPWGQRKTAVNPTLSAALHRIPQVAEPEP